MVAKILLEEVEKEHRRFKTYKIDSEGRIKTDYALTALKNIAGRFLDANLLTEEEWIAIATASHGINTRVANEIRESSIA